MKLGLHAKLYYASASRATWGAAAADGVHEGVAPTLAEVANVKDLSIGLEKDEADITTRGNGGSEAVTGTLKKAPVEFEMIYNPTGDTAQLAMLNSYLASTPIAFAVLDGDAATAGTEGFWADFEVLAFKKGEQLKDAQMVNITMKPTFSAVAPEYVRVVAP